MSSSALSSLAPLRNDDASLTGLYHRMSDLSGAMLEAAQRQDWDAVVNAEKTCASLVEALSSQPRREPANEAERQECMRLIRKVLADDAEVRNLAQPWMQELGRILHGRRAASPSFR